MDDNQYGALGDDTLNNTNRTEQILGPYNRIIPQLLSGSEMRLSFVGIDRTNYVLERSFKLLAANWVPQATNPADSVGVLVLTNTLNTATDNFWRIHSVPELYLRESVLALAVQEKRTPPTPFSLPKGRVRILRSVSSNRGPRAEGIRSGVNSALLSAVIKAKGL